MKISSSVFIILFSCYHLASAQEAEEKEIVTYEIEKPSDVKAGEVFEIKTKFSVADGWYIYAPTGVNESQGFIETRVIFNPPKGMSRAGKPNLPEVQFKNGHEIYEGSGITMSQAFKAALAGSYNIKARVNYQTCNDTICLPPRTDDVVLTVVVK